MATCRRCGLALAYCGHFQPRMPTAASPIGQCAAPRVRNLVYSAMLQSLPLSSQHYRQLRDRGLSDNEIQSHGYRTLPRHRRSSCARRLVDQFGSETCAQIPGLYQVVQGGCQYWNLAGSPGLLIPVRDRQGHIV